MDSGKMVVNIPATPEYVLAVLLDQSRRRMGPVPCAHPDSVLFSMDSPFDDLCEVCDLNYDMNIILSPMHWFGLDFCEWRDALETTKVYTVRDFCELIASQIMLPRIPLVSFCGQTCQSASVFLTIRSLLQDAGVDVKEIAPSTPLQEYTRYYTQTFLGPIARLAPGALPTVKIDEGFKYLRQFIRDIWGIPVLLIYFYTFFHPKAYPGLFEFSVLIYVFLILKTVGDEKSPPVRVEFGELRTFRDLSELIASRAAFQA